MLSGATMKKLLITILMFLLAVLTVSADSLDVKNTSSNSFVLDTSKTISVNFLINNSNASALTVTLPSPINFTGTAGSKAIGFSYNTSTNLIVPANSVKHVRMSAIIDPLTLKTGNYTGLVNVTATGHSGSFNINLDVPGTTNFTVANPSMTVIQGLTGDASFLVTNTGNTDLSLELAVSDLKSGSNTIPSNNIILTTPLSVGFGKSKNANVTVKVAESTPSGSYSGTINLTSGRVTKSAALTVTVNAASRALSVENAAATFKINVSGSSVQTNYKVTNNGNINATVDVTGALKNTTLSFNPNSFTLTPGASQSVTLTISNINLKAGIYTGVLNATTNNILTQSTLTLTVQNPISSMSVPESLQLGGENQRRNRTESTSFTITNNGDFTLTNIELTSTADNRFKINMTPNLISSLAKGASVTVTVSYFVPKNKDAANQNIGNIQVKSDQITKNIGLSMQAKNQLKISDIDVIVDGASDDVTNGGTVDEDVFPGSEVEIRIEIENLFDKSEDEDFEIRDVDLDVEIEDMDEDGGDLDFNTEFDINADDQEKFQFSFTTPLDVDEEDKKVIIKAFGRDENGARHGQEVTVRLDVRRKNHDLRISRAEFNPRRISCDRRTTMVVEVSNLGASDEDDVLLTVENSDLGLSFEEEFALDKANDRDDKATRNFRITVPDSSREGTYRFTAKVFYGRNTIINDVKDVDLQVERCSVTPSVQPIQPQEPATGQPSVVVPTLSGTTFAEPARATSKTGYIVALISVTALLSLAIIGVIFKLLFAA